MNKYIVKLQFYTPDQLPTSRGEFPKEAEDKATATAEVIKDLKTLCFNNGAEFSEREFSVVEVVNAD